MGSHTCKCLSGLVRGEEGDCITREEREEARSRQAKKAKKKAKKKKKALAAKQEGNVEEEEELLTRRHYAWYYALAPLTAAYLVYKSWRPNLVTSLGILLFVVVSATLNPY